MSANNDLIEALIGKGYHSLRTLPTGEVAGVMRMLFTHGLFVGLSRDDYRTRFCYEHQDDAVEALRKWNGNGDPPGMWIKEKPSDRLGPGATK